MRLVYVVIRYSEDGGYSVYGVYNTYKRTMQAIKTGQQEDFEMGIDGFWCYDSKLVTYFND